VGRRRALRDMGSLAGPRLYPCLVRAPARPIPALRGDHAVGKRTNAQRRSSPRHQPCVTGRVVDPRAAGRGPDDRLGDRGGRSGGRMRVSGKQTAPPAVALAGLARRLRSRRRRSPGIEQDLHHGVQRMRRSSRRAAGGGSVSAMARTDGRFGPKTCRVDTDVHTLVSRPAGSDRVAVGSHRSRFAGHLWLVRGRLREAHSELERLNQGPASVHGRHPSGSSLRRRPRAADAGRLAGRARSRCG
jgi:hypothetical protein